MYPSVSHQELAPRPLFRRDLRFLLYPVSTFIIFLYLREPLHTRLRTAHRFHVSRVLRVLRVSHCLPRGSGATLGGLILQRRSPILSVLKNELDVIEKHRRDLSLSHGMSPHRHRGGVHPRRLSLPKVYVF